MRKGDIVVFRSNGDMNGVIAEIVSGNDYINYTLKPLYRDKRWKKRYDTLGFNPRCFKLATALDIAKERIKVEKR